MHPVHEVILDEGCGTWHFMACYDFSYSPTLAVAQEAGRASSDQRIGGLIADPCSQCALGKILNPNLPPKA